MTNAKLPKVCTYNDKFYVETSLERTRKIMEEWPSWKRDSMRDRDEQQKIGKDLALVYAK